MDHLFTRCHYFVFGCVDFTAFSRLVHYFAFVGLPSLFSHCVFVTFPRFVFHPMSGPKLQCMAKQNRWRFGIAHGSSKLPATGGNQTQGGCTRPRRYYMSRTEQPQARMHSPANHQDNQTNWVVALRVPVVEDLPEQSTLPNNPPFCFANINKIA